MMYSKKEGRKDVFHDWCNKDCSMFCPVFGILHIK